MIGKGKTNVSVIIESQYEFLDYLIKDVAQRYYKNYMAFDDMAEKESRDVSGGDIDVYHSYLKSYEEELYKLYDIVLDSRRTIFISIISYLERSLYSIIKYYHITIKNEPNIKVLINKLKINYKNKYNEELYIPNECIVKDFYRLLRDLYLHGHLDTETKQKQLRHYTKSCDKIDSSQNIIDNVFLLDALKNVYDLLKTIELAYEKDGTSNKHSSLV